MKNSLFSKATLLLMTLFCYAGIFAQTTGSFNDSVMFMSHQSLLSLYVPSSYNSATAYRLMICLHGLGDNCTNYRNGLINSLSWGNNITNTIFVCPEAANVNADYYYPTGGEGIIQASIDYAMQHYHIDTNNVILQGFSLGGRAALRYGLDNYGKFKGLLLNTPAVQGVKEALNRGTYNFTYANAKHIPIYITHGGTDYLYEAPVDTAYLNLVLNDGVVRYSQFPSLGHAIPPIAQILNFISFFDSPARAGFDADLVNIDIAQRSCNTTTATSWLLRNTGTDTIHSAILHYSINANNYSYSWTGILAPFQHTMITLPAITLTVGNNALTVNVDTLDLSIADTILSNNSKSSACQVVTTGSALPLFEGFEAAVPPTNWVQNVAGDYYTPWFQDSSVFKTGYASAGALNCPLIFENGGRKEDLASPVLDLTSISNPNLQFDVAYNYYKYTKPTSTIDTVFADTLEVLISTDCGNTNTVIYKKGGAQLTTFAKPLLNIFNLNNISISPADTNWRTEFVDLTPYAGNNEAIVTFRYISSNGGDVYIDNVNFSNTPLSVRQLHTSKYNVYPNPANDVVNISTGGEAITNLEVIDRSGKTLMSINGRGNSELNVNTTALSMGIYIFRIYTESGVQSTKVVLMK